MLEQKKGAIRVELDDEVLKRPNGGGFLMGSRSERRTSDIKRKPDPKLNRKTDNTQGNTGGKRRRQVGWDRSKKKEY